MANGDSDTSAEDNVNMFHRKYRQSKANPLFSSNPPSPMRPVESSHSDSPGVDDDIAPSRRPTQQKPIYSEVRI